MKHGPLPQQTKTPGPLMTHTHTRSNTHAHTRAFSPHVRTSSISTKILAQTHNTCFFFSALPTDDALICEQIPRS